jgi:uncharacterized protein
LKYLKQFIIPIVGLDDGSHQYNFDIEGLFFEHFGENEIRKCQIHLDLDLLKQEDMIVLQFRFKGHLELICDRCLDPFKMPLSFDESIVLKFGKEAGKKKGEEEIIPHDLRELDLGQYIFDFINLKIPFRKVHPDDKNGKSECDPEVIRKIEELSIRKETDPRWDQLKNIQNN